MLAELLEQQHGEQVRAGPAARRDVERRRRLADPLAVPARHLLAHVLDHLPLARDHLQRLGDGLAELAQPRAAAAVAGRRRRNDDALARQMLGERLAGRAFARERRNVRRLGGGALGGDLVLGGGGLQLFELQLHLIEQARRALRARPVDLPLELGDLQVLTRDRRRVVGQLGAGERQLGSQRSDVVRKIGGCESMRGWNHRPLVSPLAESARAIPRVPGGMCEPGYASRSRRATTHGNAPPCEAH